MINMLDQLKNGRCYIWRGSGLVRKVIDNNVRTLDGISKSEIDSICKH